MLLKIIIQTILFAEARKLQDNELPLTVQLKWVKDDREGRFLLRNEDDHRPVCRCFKSIFAQFSNCI